MRGAPFDDEHLGRHDEEEREAELAAALPPFDSTFVNCAFLFEIIFVLRCFCSTSRLRLDSV